MSESLEKMRGNKYQTKEIEYSLVIPVYNEEESLETLIFEIQEVMTSLKGSYEIVFVNDFSDDRSTDILEDYSRKLLNIVRVITLTRRSGQTMALRKGLQESKGKFVVTLDADLQNDPADIPRMLKKLEEDYDCVCGWRKERQDTMLKSKLSKFGNVLQRFFTGLKIHDTSCTLRVYKREYVDKISLNWEGQHRFIPLSLSLQGYKIGEIVSHHRKRKFGITKYGHKRIFRVIFDFFRILIESRKK
jgi:glycosyltransferase involved in cell wall biosynthesis